DRLAHASICRYRSGTERPCAGARGGAHRNGRAGGPAQSSSCYGRGRLGFSKFAVGEGWGHAGHRDRGGKQSFRVTGGAGLSSADLRYPRQTLWADYIRAAIGTVLCGLPLLLVEVNRWVAVMLGAGFILFGVFFVRTALRQRTRYVLGPDTLCADGPAGSIVEWNRLDRLKLSYFSTKRDRSGGWRQLAIGST